MTTMLLSALGALLCSLVVTAEVMPQGDFNLQGVRERMKRGIRNQRYIENQMTRNKLGIAMEKKKKH